MRQKRMTRQIVQHLGKKEARVYLKTPNAPGQRAFSRCAAPFFLEIRQYSFVLRLDKEQKLNGRGRRFLSWYVRCRQGFAIEEGWRLVNEQNEVCGAHISLKTGSDTPLMLKPPCKKPFAPWLRWKCVELSPLLLCFSPCHRTKSNFTGCMAVLSEIFFVQAK